MQTESTLLLLTVVNNSIVGSSENAINLHGCAVLQNFQRTPKFLS
jgi:hypothetical protein